MKFTSPVYSAASGSIAGITYSRNKGGMYTRARAVPTNPNSPRQQAVRANLAACANYWTNVLTSAERQAWADYAQNVPVLDKLGASITLTGQQMFNRTNTVCLSAGIAMITAAPAILDKGTPIGPITLDADDTAETLTVTCQYDATPDMNATVPIQIGIAQSLSINYFKAPFRQLATATVSLPFDTATAIVPYADLPFSNPVADTKIPIRVRSLANDGRLTEPTMSLVVPTITP